MNRTRITFYFLLLWLLTRLVMAPYAWATQVHTAPEGLYAHQIGHFFFMVSMGTLIYWLRAHGLTRQKGWRCIQYAAFCFILWNIDAALAHHFEGMKGLFTTSQPNSWNAVIIPIKGKEWMTTFYYLLKMDHLFCVPAIVFLYLALRQLLRQATVTKERQA